MKTFIKKWLLAPGIADVLYRIVSGLVRGAKPAKSAVSKSDEGMSLDTVMSAGWDEFRARVSQAKVYAEYGSGESTVYVAAHTDATIRSIESDPEWVEKLRGEISRPSEVLHVDVGPTGRWGKPVSYAHAEKFGAYLLAPFESGYSPDFVLIDGRFRVACFLTTLLHTKPGTTIVVDDYVSRPHYQLIQDLVTPDHIGVRQAIFIRPKTIPEKKVKELLAKFEYVMD